MEWMSKNSADQLKSNCCVVTDRMAQRRHQPCQAFGPCCTRVGTMERAV
jgi:hypothetical protein